MMPLMATQTMVINTDPDCSWTTDPDMVLVISLGQDITKVPVGIAGHADLHGPNDCVALEQQHGLRWQPRSLGQCWLWIFLYVGFMMLACNLVILFL